MRIPETRPLFKRTEHIVRICAGCSSFVRNAPRQPMARSTARQLGSCWNGWNRDTTPCPPCPPCPHDATVPRCQAIRVARGDAVHRPCKARGGGHGTLRWQGQRWPDAKVRFIRFIILKIVMRFHNLKIMPGVCGHVIHSVPCGNRARPLHFKHPSGTSTAWLR